MSHHQALPQRRPRRLVPTVTRYMVLRREIGLSIIAKGAMSAATTHTVRELAVAIVLEELYAPSKRCSCVVTCEEESNGEYIEDKGQS